MLVSYFRYFTNRYLNYLQWSYNILKYLTQFWRCCIFNFSLYDTSYNRNLFILLVQWDVVVCSFSIKSQIYCGCFVCFYDYDVCFPHHASRCARIWGQMKSYVSQWIRVLYGIKLRIRCSQTRARTGAQCHRFTGSHF